MRDDLFAPTPLELIELAIACKRAKTLFAPVALGLPTLLARRSLRFEEAADRFFNAYVTPGIDLFEVAGRIRLHVNRA